MPSRFNAFDNTFFRWPAGADLKLSDTVTVPLLSVKTRMTIYGFLMFLQRPVRFVNINDDWRDDIEGHAEDMAALKPFMANWLCPA